jgi:hypothetical protein
VIYSDYDNYPRFTDNYLALTTPDCTVDARWVKNEPQANAVAAAAALPVVAQDMYARRQEYVAFLSVGSQLNSGTMITQAP